MIFETVKTFNEKREIKRIKTSVILWSGFACIPLGIFLIANEIFLGGILIITVAPCLFLYPIIRFFIFGGKDSAAAVVTTVVVEEATKHIIGSAIKDKKKKKN